jgi:hypothetical protein
MIAQRLIEDARAAGLSMEVEGGDLIVEADRDPPPGLLAELRQHKAEVIAFLVPPPLASAPPLPELDDFHDRAAIIECRANVPRRWVEGYEALCTMPAPAGFSSERWHRIVDAIEAFLDRWAAKAIACGWSDLDLFGVDADAPDRRFDCMGLTLMLHRAEITGIDENGADLMMEGKVTQRYRRKPRPVGTVALWQLMK